MPSLGPSTPAAASLFPQDRRAGNPNRRRFTRVPARQLRGCLIARGVVSDNVWVVDISLGGAFLRTPEPLPIDEPIALELPQPGQRPALRLLGHVVSRRVLVNAPRPPGMGVCFDRVSPMTLVELRELIRTFAPSAVLEARRREDQEETKVAPIPGAPSVSATPPPLPSAPANRPPPAIPPGSSGGWPLVTAAEPAPLGPRASAPRPPVHLAPVPAAADDAQEVRQLKNHVKGLLVQLGEVQSQLAVKTRENEALREAVTRLQASNAALRRG